MDAENPSQTRTRYIVIGSLFLVGFACAGPIGGVSVSVAGNLLSNVIERQAGIFSERLFGSRGRESLPLAGCMTEAFGKALDKIEVNWNGLARDDRAAQSVHGAIQIIRDEARAILGAENTYDIAAEVLKVSSGSSLTSSIEHRLFEEIDSFLYGHEPQFIELFRRTFLSELEVSFLETITSVSPSRPAAWRCYQLLAFQSLNDALASIQRDQAGLADQFEELGRSFRENADLLERLKKLPVELIDPQGEQALQQRSIELQDELRESLDSVRTAIRQEHRTTRSVILEHGDENTQRILDRLQDEGREKWLSDVDVLLRGPLSALSLQRSLEIAEASVEPIEAARFFGEIAASLSSEGFEFEARLIRNRQAEKLVEIGEVDAGYDIWIKNAWAEAEEGRLWLSPYLRDKLYQHEQSVPEGLSAAVDALEAFEEWYESPASSLAAIQLAFEAAYQAQDAWTPLIGRVLGELSSVDEDVLSQDSGLMVARLRETAANTDADTSLRILISIAELTGDWDDLPEQAASDELDAVGAGLLLARYGRWLCLQGQPERAIRQYRKSIGFFARKKYLGDVAAALRSIDWIENRCLPLYDSDARRERRNLATMLADRGSCLAGITNARSMGLEALHAGKLPDAHRALRRYLLEARISGRLPEELDAHRLLGDLMAEANEIPVAVRHYILSGQSKRAATVSGSYPSAIDVTGFLNSKAHWVVGSALSVIAQQGDLWPEERVSEFLPQIFNALETEQESIFDPNVATEGWRAMASVAIQISDRDAERVLDLVDPLIEREQNHYRRTDDSVLALLKTFHRFRPRLRQRVNEYLSRCLVDHELAGSLMRFVCNNLSNDHHLRKLVKLHADGGNTQAARMLGIAGFSHTLVAQEARKYAEIVLNYETGVERNSAESSSKFQTSAQLAQALEPSLQLALSDHLLRIAKDEKSPSDHRGSAKEALGILSDELATTQRDAAFEVALSLVHSGPSSHPLDNFWQSSLHPLSRFRFNFGASDYRLAAMWSAARLARKQQEGQQVLELLMPFLMSQDANFRDQAAQAISWMKQSALPDLPIDWLATNVIVHLRYLATDLWVQSEEPSLRIGLTLAQDSDVGVRSSFASAINTQASKRGEPFKSIQEMLRHDPSAKVRAFATIAVGR